MHGQVVFGVKFFIALSALMVTLNTMLYEVDNFPLTFVAVEVGNSHVGRNISFLWFVNGAQGSRSRGSKYPGHECPVHLTTQIATGTAHAISFGNFA